MKQLFFAKKWLIIGAILVIGGGGAAFYLTDGFGLMKSDTENNNPQSQSEKSTGTKLAKENLTSEELLQNIVDGKTTGIIHCTYTITSEKPGLQDVEVHLKDSGTLIGHQGGDKANMLIKDKKVFIWGSKMANDGGPEGMVLTYNPNNDMAKDIDKSTGSNGILSPTELVKTAQDNGQNNDVKNVKCEVANNVDDSIFSHPNGIIFQDMTNIKMN